MSQAPSRGGSPAPFLDDEVRVRWLSVDPATKTGIARWSGGVIEMVATLRPATPAERRKRQAPQAVVVEALTRGGVDRQSIVYHDELSAWAWLLTQIEAVVAEEGFGPSPKTVAQHAFRRGFVAAMCAMRRIPFHVVNVSEWRRVVGAANGFTFPRDSSQAKARAMELVEARFGQRVSDDEADAACAGLWALQTRTVQP